MNFNPSTFASSGPAFVAGLVTSLHCAGMCGPLACSILGSGGRQGLRAGDANSINTVYHVSRLTAYAIVGALAGAIGRGPLLLLTESSLRWLPWLLVLFFLALAFRWDRHLPHLGPLGGIAWRLRMRLREHPLGSAAALGFATPALPCGPLYMLFGFAMISGSAIHGAETALAFGLGTVPLLWFAQAGSRSLSRRLPPLWLGRARSGLALVAAGVLAWRLRATLGFNGPDPLSFVCF